MATVTIHAAKTTLSQLLARVEAGEEIIIARGKEPVARLTAFHPPVARREFGAMRGVVSVGDAFFDPLSDIDLANWE